MILLADRQIFAPPSRTTATKEMDVEGNKILSRAIYSEIQPFFVEVCLENYTTKKLHGLTFHL